MKKLICILLAFGLLCYSCSEDPDDKIVVPSEPTISLSIKSVGFPIEGGAHMLLIATNQSTWDVKNNNSWIDVDRKEQTATIRVKPTAGTSAISGFVYFETGDGSGIVKDSVYVMQSGLVVNDLSAEGTANCYIAKPGNDYCFNATIKGNGQEVDGNSKYIETYGLDIEGGVYADLIWESTLDGDKARSLDILGYPLLKGGKIYFSTLGSAGNGVLAVKNSTGDILWSWHIWVLEDDFTTSDATIEDVTWTWMDRNLGAANNTPTDPSNRGLLYQSGRKDPFLPSIAPANAQNTDVTNYTTGKGSGVWQYDFTTPANINPPANIPPAIRHPMGFFGHNPNLDIYADWYLPHNHESKATSHLWGDPELGVVKTLFDPCPLGYTIPPMTAVAGSKRTPITTMWRNEPDEHGEFYGWYWKDGTDDFFPFTGRLLYWTWGGYLSDSGTYASYWTRYFPGGSATGTVAFSMWIRTSVIKDPTVGYAGISRTYGNAIRCIKEV